MTTQQLKGKTTISYGVWKKQSKDERIEWENKIYDWEKEWKQHLFKEYGVEENPKREDCFGLAWEEGHAYGYEEIENCFSKYVELIK